VSRPPAAAALVATVGAALTFALGAATASAAPVANGGFETGAVEGSGWHVESSGGDGQWTAISGEESPLSHRPVLGPSDGSFDALADATESASTILYQDVPLAAGETHQLSLDLNYRSDGPIVVPDPNTLEVMTTEVSEGVYEVQPNEQVRVDVMKPDAPVTSLAPADVLDTVFATEEGESEEQMYWTQLHADLSEFAGQTVRIRIAVVASVNPLNAGVDDVAIASAPVPVSEPQGEPATGPTTATVPVTTSSSTISATTTVGPKCVAPKLKGLGLKAAKRSIRGAGCSVGHVGRRKGVTAASGSVVRQTPMPGTSLPPGAKIAIKLG
jgi:hypothetical protein